MAISSLQAALRGGEPLFFLPQKKSRLFQDFSVFQAANSRQAFSSCGIVREARCWHVTAMLVLATWLGFGPSQVCASDASKKENQLTECAFSSGQENSLVLPESKEAATLELSGSRFPGVLDHLLIMPDDPEAVSEKGLQVHINYPSTGKRLIDADIRDWVTNMADIFISHIDASTVFSEPDIVLDAEGFLQDNDLNLPLPESRNFELWGDYTISRPSGNALSITFEIWNYAGNPEGNLDILTLNYNLLNSQRLELVDIFEDPDQALQLMSNYSRRTLETRLGAGARAKMLIEGTAPLAENFSSLTLTKDGLCINFQPWQVAPWEAGIQKVNMPLEELLAAVPLLALWEK